MSEPTGSSELSHPAAVHPTATQPVAAPAATRAPNASECRFCGSAPAASVTFRGHQGIVLFARFLSTPGPFCRDCGVATFRSMTADTLTQGWWGAISFFVTPVTVLINLFRRPKVTRLGPPQKDPMVVAPLAQPMNLGKPVLARPSVWILLVFMVVVTGLLVNLYIVEEARRSVGGCTRGVQFVDCTQRHEGVIVKVVTNVRDCPASADGYIQDRTRIYCIKDD